MTTRLGLWARIMAPFAAALVVVGGLTLVVRAHHNDVTDPNDTRGLLDVRTVALAHEGRAPTWTVTTFRRWTAREVWDKAYVEVLIDTIRRSDPDYYVLVRSIRTQLQGSLWRNRAGGPDSYLGPVEVRRPSRRSVRFTLKLWRLDFGRNRDFYRWSVHTAFTSTRCRRSCHDTAPNGQPPRQWLPGRSPTPTSSG